MPKITHQHKLGQLLLVVVLAVSSLSFTSQPILAGAAHDAGDIDPSFGVDGEVLAQIYPGEAHWGPKLLILPNNKIVIGGVCGDEEEFCLMRFNADGTLDKTFGAPNGYVTSDLTPGEDDSLRDIALQADGKIVAIGDCDSPQQICLVRYNTDGSLDTAGFGAPDGFVKFEYGFSDAEGESLAIQSDGKIIVAGECDDDDFLCVSRRNSDGSEDTTFNGVAGYISINPSASPVDDEDPEVALQSDGKIVIFASCDDRDDLCVARFNSDGTEDTTTFGVTADNYTTTPIGGGDNYPGEVRITSSGQILGLGECDDITYFCLVAYDDSGALDTSFGGGDGIALTEAIDNWNSGEGMILQGDGKILAVGTCGEFPRLCLLRYKGNGDLDPGFGKGGVVTHIFASDIDFGKDVALQSDGKIIVSGDCGNGDYFCLARFYGDATPDTTFYTGIDGGIYSYDGVWISIPAGAIPASPDANANKCILTIHRVGQASRWGLELDENIWNVTIKCDGHLVTQFQGPLTICLPPKDYATTGKQVYARHTAESGWEALPLADGKAGHVCGITYQLSLFVIGTPDYPLTGYPPGLITQLPAQPAAKAYAPTGMTLSIPTLDVEMDIVGVPQTPTGWDITWLGNEAGYLYGTAFPTWDGNSVITGHVWQASNRPGPFYQLKELVYGDQIVIEYQGQDYVYEVRESQLVSGARQATFEHSDTPMLTLITCETFAENTDEYASRRLVSAVLVVIR